MDINDIPLEARTTFRDEPYVYVTRTDHEHVSRRAESFGLFDAKGRELGYMYCIDREYHIIDANSSTLHRLEGLETVLEESFIVEPHGMRDGKPFGALPVASYKRFKTLAEAEAYGAKVIDRAYKRAIKQASA